MSLPLSGEVPGWERIESNSKPGKFYYFNATTGKTSWKKPGTSKKTKTKTKANKTSSVAVGKRSLPPTPSAKPHTHTTSPPPTSSSSSSTSSPPTTSRTAAKATTTTTTTTTTADTKPNTTAPDPSVLLRQHSGPPLPARPASFQLHTHASLQQLPQQQQQQQKVIQFPAKLILDIESARNLSTSKGSFYCIVSMWRSRTGIHESSQSFSIQKIEEEEYETERADGAQPVWKEVFHFGGQHLDLDTVDFVQIDVYKKNLFSSTSMGKVCVSLNALRRDTAKNKTAGKKDRQWHALEKTKKMKTVRGEVLLVVEYRPGGEFVEGSVSNVRHHGHVGITPEGKLDLKNIPGPWKNLFKEAGIKKKDIKNNSDAVMKVLVQYGLIPRSMFPNVDMQEDEKNQTKAEQHEPTTIQTRLRTSSNTTRRGRLLFQFDAMDAGELNAQQNEIVVLIECHEDFWLVQNDNGQEGFVQSDYIEELYALPLGWSEIVTENDEVYYYNESTNEASWDRPPDQPSSIGGSGNTTETETKTMAPVEKNQCTDVQAKEKKKEEREGGKKKEEKEEEREQSFVQKQSIVQKQPIVQTQPIVQKQPSNKVPVVKKQPVVQKKPIVQKKTIDQKNPIVKKEKTQKTTESKATNPSSKNNQQQPKQNRTTPQATIRPSPTFNFLSQIRKGTTLKDAKSATTTAPPTAPTSSNASRPPLKMNLLSQIQQGKKLKRNTASSTSTPQNEMRRPPPKINFLSQIKQGKQLKSSTTERHVHKPPPRQGGVRLDLFAQIKSGGANLKKVDPKLLEKKKTMPSGGGGIMDALRMAVNKNRSAIAGGNNSDTGDDSDDDYWSD